MVWDTLQLVNWHSLFWNQAWHQIEQHNEGGLPKSVVTQEYFRGGQWIYQSPGRWWQHTLSKYPILRQDIRITSYWHWLLPPNPPTFPPPPPPPLPPFPHETHTHTRLCWHGGIGYNMRIGRGKASHRHGTGVGIGVTTGVGKGVPRRDGHYCRHRLGQRCGAGVGKSVPHRDGRALLSQRRGRRHGRGTDVDIGVITGMDRGGTGTVVGIDVGRGWWRGRRIDRRGKSVGISRKRGHQSRHGLGFILVWYPS